jgi:hypothetical protein
VGQQGAKTCKGGGVHQTDPRGFEEVITGANTPTISEDVTGP